MSDTIPSDADFPGIDFLIGQAARHKKHEEGLLRARGGYAGQFALVLTAEERRLLDEMSEDELRQRIARMRKKFESGEQKPPPPPEHRPESGGIPLPRERRVPGTSVQKGLDLRRLREEGERRKRENAGDLTVQPEPPKHPWWKRWLGLE